MTNGAPHPASRLPRRSGPGLGEGPHCRTGWGGDLLSVQDSQFRLRRRGGRLEFPGPPPARFPSSPPNRGETLTSGLHKAPRTAAPYSSPLPPYITSPGGTERRGRPAQRPLPCQDAEPGPVPGRPSSSSSSAVGSVPIVPRSDDRLPYPLQTRGRRGQRPRATPHLPPRGRPPTTTLARNARRGPPDPLPQPAQAPSVRVAPAAPPEGQGVAARTPLSPVTPFTTALPPPCRTGFPASTHLVLGVGVAEGRGAHHRVRSPRPAALSLPSAQHTPAPVSDQLAAS